MRLLIATALALTLLAAPAQAATVSMRTTTTELPGGKGVAPTTWVTRALQVHAGDGEANALVVAVAGGAFVVRDTGAPLVAGEGCAPGEGGAVVCAHGHADQLDADVRLGDGDDAADLALGGPGFPPQLLEIAVDGGAGADTLAADGGIVAGGDGDDTLALRGKGTLRGGAGADSLSGSAADDVLDGGPGRDALDGGAGTDTVSYEGRAEAVVVDLGAPTAGAPGEEDSIAGFEGALGGDGADLLRAPATGAPAALRGKGGDDVLEGAAGGDDLEGGAGDDRISGGDGADQIDAGGGDDAVDAGPGDDRVDDLDTPRPIGADRFRGGPGDDALIGDIVHGGPGDDALIGRAIRAGAGDDEIRGPRTEAQLRALDCGPGRDLLTQPARRLVLPGGCERVDPWGFGRTWMRVPPRIRARQVTLRVPNPCLFAHVPPRCAVEAELRIGPRSAGTRTARWRRYREGARVLRWTLPAPPRRGAILRLELTKRETGERVERGGYAVRLGR